MPLDLISAGSTFSCGVAGELVKCWGVSQAATGTTMMMRGSPIAATMFPELDVGGTVVQISAAFNHVCALLDTAAVRCWGLNFAGTLGYANMESIGDDESPASAGDVAIGGDAISVGANANSCAVLSNGTVRCWGYGSAGGTGQGNTDDIGDDETPDSVPPIAIGGTAVMVGNGIDAACVLRDDGAVVCWGLNAYGSLGYGHLDEIGDDETPDSQGTVNVGGTVVELAVGGQGACVRLDTGAVRCWGRNDRGDLGYGHTDDIGDDEDPVMAGDVNVGGNVVQLSKGDWSTCALLDTAEVKCWGRGDFGQLGQGNTEDIGDDETPADIDPIDLGGPAAHVDAGRDFNCALLTDGAVKCWGRAELIGYGDTEDIGDDEVPADAPNLEVF